MRKKIISLVLALAMLAASVCTAFAATVDVSGSDVKKLVSFFSDNTPATMERRLEILEYIRMYMGGTDRDMETLINALKNKDFDSLSSGSTDLKSIFDKVTGDDEIYSSALFVLEMIRAIPAESRETAIDGFGVKKDDARVSYTIQDTDRADEINTALLALYNDDEVYPAKLRNALEEHVAFDSAVAPYVVLNLFTAWKDTIQLTDDTDGTGFAAYQVDSAYAKRLMDYMDDYTLNGKKIGNAMDIAEMLADVINSSYSKEQIANMKKVLDDSGLNIYVSTDSMFEMGSILVNGKSVDLSLEQNKPTKVKVSTSSFTVEGTTKTAGAKIEYAYVDSGNASSEWRWFDDMEDENIRVGDNKKVAVRITSKDGTNSEIYFVTISRPSSDSSSSSSGNRRPSSDVVTEPDNTIPAPPVSDVLFADTANHWAKDYINAMVNRGLFKGYEDGTFQPEWGVTRQEMAVVLVRLLNLEGELGSVTTTEYTDDQGIAAWAHDSVALLSAKGIYLGYDDGEFKPERVLSREEIVALAMRLYGYSSADTTADYSDVERIGEWARKAVGQATNLGIISGRGDGLFAPAANVTRAEAAKILYNYMNVKGIY